MQWGGVILYSHMACQIFKGVRLWPARGGEIMAGKGGRMNPFPPPPPPPPPMHHLATVCDSDSLHVSVTLVVKILSMARLLMHIDAQSRSSLLCMSE